MTYASDFRKFVTSQYINFGLRIAFAILLPSVLLAHFGLLKEYYLFPLGTSFVGGTDQPGPFIRRRNTLLFASFTFVIVALIASLVKDYQFLVYPEILFFGLFFSMLGVYGQRLGSVGAFALIVMAIFIDGHLTGSHIMKNMLVLLAGCLWFVIFLFIAAKIQPYKLARQMVGENYLELAEFLKLKANFYAKNPDYDKLFSQTISAQIKIKDLQEATRETVFKTREIVKESTATSRVLMLMFLNSIDLHEKLMTSESEYRKLHDTFGTTEILPEISNYLYNLARQLTAIGIALQSGTKAAMPDNFSDGLHALFDTYFRLRERQMTSETLEDFMVLRQILSRIADITAELKTMYGVLSQDAKFAKSLSAGLDIPSFISKEEQLNLKVLRTNLSLESAQFRHAVRVTSALLLGYTISRFFMLGIGHTYWILISIIAIMKPAYAITKNRNLLRVGGTMCGGIFAYLLIYLVPNTTALFLALLMSISLCYSLIRTRYFWAVFFMTAYILLAFNFLRPGNAAVIFRDRLIDTAVGGIISLAISYLVLPVWEHTRTPELMKKSLSSNYEYFQIVMESLIWGKIFTQKYKLRRKDAIIDLANLSDNFQKMISDPKNQQKRQQMLHQFVNTSQLITAYTASLGQFIKNGRNFPEIDFEIWQKKISAEFLRSEALLKQEKLPEGMLSESKLMPHDQVDELIDSRKNELAEDEFYDHRDISKTTHLTELKNIREILSLISNTAKEQQKVLQQFYSTPEQP